MSDLNIKYLLEELINDNYQKVIEILKFNQDMKEEIDNCFRIWIKKYSLTKRNMLLTSTFANYLDLDYQNNSINKTTIPMFMTENNEITVMETIFSLKFNCNLLDTKGNSLLHYLIKSNLQEKQILKFIKEINNRNKFIVDIINNNKDTPLVLAASLGFPKICEELITMGANVYYINPNKKNSLLHYAAKSKNSSVIKIFNSLDPFLVNIKGETPYDIVKNSGLEDLIKLFGWKAKINNNTNTNTELICPFSEFKKGNFKLVINYFDNLVKNNTMSSNTENIWNNFLTRYRLMFGKFINKQYAFSTKEKDLDKSDLKELEETTNSHKDLKINLIKILIQNGENKEKHNSIYYYNLSLMYFTSGKYDHFIHYINLAIANESLSILLINYYAFLFDFYTYFKFKDKSIEVYNKINNLCNEINPSLNIFPSLKNMEISMNNDSNNTTQNSDFQNNDDGFSKSKLLNLLNKNDNELDKKKVSIYTDDKVSNFDNVIDKNLNNKLLGDSNEAFVLIKKKDLVLQKYENHIKSNLLSSNFNINDQNNEQNLNFNETKKIFKPCKEISEYIELMGLISNFNEETSIYTHLLSLALLQLSNNFNKAKNSLSEFKKLIITYSKSKKLITNNLSFIYTYMKIKNDYLSNSFPKFHTNSIKFFDSFFNLGVITTKTYYHYHNAVGIYNLKLEKYHMAECNFNIALNTLLKLEFSSPYRHRDIVSIKYNYALSLFFQKKFTQAKTVFLEIKNLIYHNIYFDYRIGCCCIEEFKTECKIDSEICCKINSKREDNNYKLKYFLSFCKITPENSEHLTEAISYFKKAIISINYFKTEEANSYITTFPKIKLLTEECYISLIFCLLISGQYNECLFYIDYLQNQNVSEETQIKLDNYKTKCLNNSGNNQKALEFIITCISNTKEGKIYLLIKLKNFSIFFQNIVIQFTRILVLKLH